MPLQTSHQQFQVQAHYRELAPHYGARANRTCEKTCFHLVKRFLGGRQRALELGSGSNDLLDRLGSPFAVACDLSLDMLRQRPPNPRIRCVVTAGERLPFADASFDSVFLINVLEHLTDVARVVEECARVLEKGGRWLAVTPNGDWERLLDWAERWSLKLPEGPHRFLTPKELGQALSKRFDIVEQRTFLLFPAGPPQLAALLDRLTFCSVLGWGFFQYIVAARR